jgi:hypothetical protein
MLFTYFLIPLLFLFSPEKEKAPPGTVLVGKYYVDYQEMTYLNWLEFQFSATRTKFANYEDIKPKGNLFINRPNERSLPLTNITYEQALMYCKWRSKVVSEIGGRKVTYRLPTEDEWLEIVGEMMGKHPKKLIKEFNKAKKSLIRPTALLTNSRTNYPTQLFYNISEMTATEGIAMGLNNSILEGSKWQDNLTHTFTYEEYSPFVGFRCIADVEEKKAKKRSNP